MAEIRKIAIVTISPYNYKKFLETNGINPNEAKHVSIKKDMEFEVFSGIELIEGHQNVTDWVKSNIKVEFNGKSR